MVEPSDRMTAARAGTWLTFALLAACMSAAAAERIPKVAVVMSAYPMSSLEKAPPEAPGAQAFFEAMKERGWIDGQNIRFVWRSAEQRVERIPAIVQELVDIKVDAIVASGNLIAETAKEKTRTIPIVVAAAELAVEAGLVQSYARPGGNVTGVSLMVEHLDAKRLGLLKNLSPGVSRVAFLGHLSSRDSFRPETRAAMEALGISAFRVRADRGEDIERAFAEAIRDGANAMIVSSNGPMYLPENQRTLHALAIRHRIPVIHAVLGAAGTGGLAAYAADERTAWRRAANYVDRILHGDDPARMPIEHPSTYYLHINRKAAAAIGLHVPASILTQADKVFD